MKEKLDTTSNRNAVPLGRSEAPARRRIESGAIESWHYSVSQLDSVNIASRTNRGRDRDIAARAINECLGRIRWPIFFDHLRGLDRRCRLGRRLSTRGPLIAENERAGYQRDPEDKGQLLAGDYTTDQATTSQPMPTTPRLMHVEAPKLR
jgi:hypothetical protein